MPHNYITNEELPTPSTPTAQSWEALGVPAALIAAGPKNAETTANQSTPQGVPSKKSKSKKASVETERDYSLTELAAMNDRQLKGYLGQNKSRQQAGWEKRVELAELVLGQRGDVL